MYITKVVQQCGLHTYTSLFPEIIDNKLLVYLINIIHIIGVFIIQVGILFPPFLLKYYIIYLIFMFASYIMLNNRCFMTVLSNYFGNKNYNSLCIKMNEARYILAIYLIVGIFFFLYPNYSIFYMLQKIFNNNIR